MSTAAERAVQRINDECSERTYDGIPFIDEDRAVAIIDEEFAPIIEQRDKAWLLAEHREQNVERERKLKEVARALKCVVEMIGTIDADTMEAYTEAKYALKQAEEAGI